MKNKTLLAILIALTVLSLACGACGLAGEVTGEPSGDESPAGTNPPDDGPDEQPAQPPDDKPKPGEGIKGIPMYPGATKVMAEAPPAAPGAAAGYKDVEAALYESTDDKKDICDFYGDKMVKAGWDKIVFMSVDEGCITSWVAKDGDIGATIVVAEQPDGKVYISIVAGKVE
jgi:hypothetical protein